MHHLTSGTLVIVFLCIWSGQYDVTEGIITYPTPTDFKNFLTNEPFKSYNKNIFPRINQADNVTVAIKFYLIAITAFDEVNGQINIVGYYDMQWDNELLTWVSAQSIMDNMLIGQDNFWRPNIVLSNSVDSLVEMGSKYYRIRIEKNGTHEWLVGSVSKTACDVDVTYYPFDRQECSIILKSWGYSPTQVVLTSSEPTIDLTHYKENVEWELESTSVKSDLTGTSPTITFKMSLKRRPVFFIVNMVVPILILGMLNSFVFLLPQDSGERVGYASTAFLTFAVFLTMVSEGLPKTSEPMSQLSYFLVVMIAVSSMSTFMTIMTLRIFHIDESIAVPKFLRYYITVLLCEPCQRRCCKEEEETDGKPTGDGDMDVQDIEEEDDDDLYDEDGNRKVKDLTKHVDWKIVAKVIDVTLFFIFTGGTGGVSYIFLAPLFSYASI